MALSAFLRALELNNPYFLPAFAAASFESEAVPP
jgi:hypothetical protein